MLYYETFLLLHKLNTVYILFQQKKKQNADFSHLKKYFLFYFNI